MSNHHCPAKGELDALGGDLVTLWCRLRQEALDAKRAIPSLQQTGDRERLRARADALERAAMLLQLEIPERYIDGHFLPVTEPWTPEDRRQAARGF